MYPASPEFFEAIKSPHRVMIIVKALSIDGTWYTLPVVDGSVKIDQTSADVRRTINLTINDPLYVPKKSTDALSIYGNHLYAYRGVVWDLANVGTEIIDAKPPLGPDLLRPENKAYELVPIGVFRITDTSIEEDKDGNVTITVNGSDMALNIKQNSWTSPVTVWKTPYTPPVVDTNAAGFTPYTTQEQNLVANTYLEAVKLLINNRWPAYAYGVFGPPVFEFAGIVDAELKQPLIMGSVSMSVTGAGSPWTDITGIAAGVNGLLYIDVEGRFCVQPQPDPASVPPVWSYVDGDGGMLTKVTRKLDSSKAVNYVIATGENSIVGMPYRALAYDSDPNSPTYYLGPFGRVVGREPGRKRLISQKQTQAAANLYLNWFVGGDETTTIEGICNPALDSGDVVLVRRKNVGIYQDGGIITDLTTDFPAGSDLTPSTVVPITTDYGNYADVQPPAKTGVYTISELKVNPTYVALAKGQEIIIYTNVATNIVKVTEHCPVGSTIIPVESFHPDIQYLKGTMILDPAFTEHGGAVNYFIDQITIPLNITDAGSLVARERRVGTKEDAARIAEFTMGY